MDCAEVRGDMRKNGSGETHLLELLAEGLLPQDVQSEKTMKLTVHPGDGRTNPRDLDRAQRGQW